MKQIIYILPFLFVLQLTSCISDLNFEEPQPTDNNNQGKFKNKYQGTYLCLSDSSILKIHKDKITQEWSFISKLTIAQIDTTKGIELHDGQIFCEGKEEPLIVEFFGDTAVINYDFERTIFEIKENELLRYFKGMYFLNFKQSDNFWTVKLLKLDKEGILTINRIFADQEEIQIIKDLTTVEEIKDEVGKIVDYKIQPTRKELKQMMKSELFKEGTRFQKIKN